MKRFDQAIHRMRGTGLILLLLSVVQTPLRAQDAWGSLQQRLVELIAANQDAMVRVHAAYAPKEEGDPAQEVIGSGFFISSKGLVLTNASIVNNPDRVWVEHRGVDYAAEIVGDDRPSNVALLSLDTLPEKFGFFHLADSAELPAVGQMVVRLSMPLRFGPSPRMGMVAGFETEFGGQMFPCKYIRVTLGAGPGEGGRGLPRSFRTAHRSSGGDAARGRFVLHPPGARRFADPR